MRSRRRRVRGIAEENPMTAKPTNPATPDVFDLLFVGTHGYVAALHKCTGKESWRTNLPDTGWSVVTLLFEEGALFAASQGHVFALDAVTGEILWRNNLPSLGSGHLCLATVRSSPSAGGAPIPQIAAADDDAAAASGGGATAAMH
jgi:outer membrane protein assembly factor BamB